MNAIHMLQFGFKIATLFKRGSVAHKINYREIHKIKDGNEK